MPCIMCPAPHADLLLEYRIQSCRHEVVGPRPPACWPKQTLASPAAPAAAAGLSALVGRVGGPGSAPPAIPPQLLMAPTASTQPPRVHASAPQRRPASPTWPVYVVQLEGVHRIWVLRVSGLSAAVMMALLAGSRPRHV